MKVAILSESAADEAALRILASAIAGRTLDTIPLSLRSRGWPAVRNVLPGVLAFLHYQTEAEALIVVADSDDSPVHQDEHDQRLEPGCRLCGLRAAVGITLRRLAPRPVGLPLKTALGLAVPAIEAWYLVGVDPHVNEAAWLRALAARQFPHDRLKLKRMVYGTDRPSIQLETNRAVEAATRLAASEGLTQLARLFPAGFGALAADIRHW